MPTASFLVFSILFHPVCMIYIFQAPSHPLRPGLTAYCTTKPLYCGTLSGNAKISKRISPAGDFYAMFCFIFPAIGCRSAIFSLKVHLQEVYRTLHDGQPAYSVSANDPYIPAVPGFRFLFQICAASIPDSSLTAVFLLFLPFLSEYFLLQSRS